MSKRKRQLPTAAEFDLMEFFTVAEVIAWTGRPRQTIRDWLDRADVVTKNGAGVPIITTERLRCCFPELLATMRRRCEAAEIAEIAEVHEARPL